MNLLCLLAEEISDRHVLVCRSLLWHCDMVSVDVFCTSYFPVRMEKFSLLWWGSKNPLGNTNASVIVLHPLVIFRTSTVHLSCLFHLDVWMMLTMDKLCDIHVVLIEPALFVFITANAVMFLSQFVYWSVHEHKWLKSSMKFHDIFEQEIVNKILRVIWISEFLCSLTSNLIFMYKIELTADGKFHCINCWLEWRKIDREVHWLENCLAFLNVYTALSAVLLVLCYSDVFDLL